MPKKNPLALALFIALLSFQLAAGDPPPDQHKPDQPPADKLSVTDGQITVDGHAIKYKATAGHMILKDDAGQAKAEMFFVAYEKQPVEARGSRPITFVFNGGPGAAALSDHLLEHQGISLNGIILISSVLNFRTIQSGGGNELPFALYLPSYTAVAHHFKKLPADLQKADLGKTLKEVEQWATHDYFGALIAGSALSEDERKTIAARLSRYTGVPAPYIE